MPSATRPTVPSKNFFISHSPVCMRFGFFEAFFVRALSSRAHPNSENQNKRFQTKSRLRNATLGSQLTPRNVMICLGYSVPSGTFRVENPAILWRCGIHVFG